MRRLGDGRWEVAAWGGYYVFPSFWSALWFKLTGGF